MKAICLVAVALLAVLVAVPASNADNCRQAVAVQQQHAVYAPSTYYAQPLVLGIFIPQPSYTVGLSVTDPASADRLDKLLQRLESLEQRLDQPPVERLKQPPTLKLSQSFQCAKCHDGTKADVPQLDFGHLSAADKALVAERILDGSMPPKGGVPKEKRRVVLAEILK